MPITLQTLIIIMIIEAQKPILYGAYGLFNLNLETFIKVNAGIWRRTRVYDYFLMYFLFVN